MCETLTESKMVFVVIWLHHVVDEGSRRSGISIVYIRRGNVDTGKAGSKIK